MRGLARLDREPHLGAARLLRELRRPDPDDRSRVEQPVLLAHSCPSRPAGRDARPPLAGLLDGDIEFGPLAPSCPSCSSSWTSCPSSPASRLFAASSRLPSRAGRASTTVPITWSPSRFEPLSPISISPVVLAGDRTGDRHRVAGVVRRAEPDAHRLEQRVRPRPVGDVPADEPVRGEDVHEDVGRAALLRETWVVVHVLVVARRDRGRRRSTSASAGWSSSGSWSPTLTSSYRRECLVVTMLVRPSAQSLAEPAERRARAAQGVLDLLAPQEVPVHRVVDVGAHAAVQVLHVVHHPLAALRRPPLRDQHVGRRVAADVELPRGLQQRRPGSPRCR